MESVHVLGWGVNKEPDGRAPWIWVEVEIPGIGRKMLRLDLDRQALTDLMTALTSNPIVSRVLDLFK